MHKKDLLFSRQVFFCPSIFKEGYRLLFSLETALFSLLTTYTERALS